jgi:predicted nucleic acid-binding protein
MTWLVDTNVISELVRPRPNRGVMDWADTVGRISLSVVSYEEIMYGLTWKPRASILTWFEQFVNEACDLLPISAAIAERAGRSRGRLKAAGVTRTQADMLIAATAHVHQLTLVTRNVADFDGCEVRLLNPFT